MADEAEAEAAKAKKQSTEEYLSHPLRRNAFLIIQKMLELNDSCEKKKNKLVDEILHSIFFLGKINTPPFSPEQILNDDQMLDELKRRYPHPFKHYSSQLPRRSPFSCVLDMIVFLEEQEKEGQVKEGQVKEGQEKEGQEKEDEIIKKLQEIISPLSKKHLVSAAICVSQNMNNQNSVCRYYGVSMSRMESQLRRIMISASCLGEYWDRYVAGAVMTYHPNDKKRLYFDGTITLPEHVRCETFKLFKGEKVEIKPCTSCKNLFGLIRDTYTAKTFPYGNCAEVESVSNLFRNDTEVRKQARPSEKNRDKAEKSVREDLMDQLKECDIKGHIQFYPTRRSRRSRRSCRSRRLRRLQVCKLARGGPEFCIP